MGGAMQKHVFGHMWSAKAQISLRIHTVWSGPSLSAVSFDIKECFNGEEMPGWDFAQVQDDVNPHILRVLKGTF